MAGQQLHAFSTHSVFTSGNVSLDARAHGTPMPSFSPSSGPPSVGFAPLSEDSTSARQIATLQAKLNKKLGPEYISQRPGPGGGPKLTYVEGWKIINLANEVFGFNGWSSSIVNITTDFVDFSEESRRFNVGVTAIVRVTLRDGVYHEDVGYGMLENGKSKGAALDKCKKEAITDALKRTLRNFGNLLGNCLYDKSYAQEVVKIKVPPVKFEKNELYHRSEFTAHMPNNSRPASHGQPTTTETPSIKHGEPLIKTEQGGHQPETPIAYVPRHLRQEMAAAAQQAQGQCETPTRALATPPQKAQAQSNGNASSSTSGMIACAGNRASTPSAAPKPNGLVTPIQTPVPAQRLPARALAPSTIASSPLSHVSSVAERKVVFAEPVQVPAREDSTVVVNQDVDNGRCEGDDDDAFPLSTQDGELFATVDLGEGDLGRPIDFEEGNGGMDTSALEPGVNIPERRLSGPPQPRPQVYDHEGESNAGPSSGGPLKTITRNEVQGAQFPPSNGSTGSNTGPGLGAPPLQPQSGPSGVGPATSGASTSTTSTGQLVQDVKRFRPMGGFHFSPDMKPPIQQQPQQYTHAAKPMASVSARATSQIGPTNALKRSADVMMSLSVSTSSARPPPLQGMGLAQRQQQQQQNASMRPPSDHNHGEGNDIKRFKR